MPGSVCVLEIPKRNNSQSCRPREHSLVVGDKKKLSEYIRRSPVEEIESEQEATFLIWERVRKSFIGKKVTSALSLEGR